jgi:hypothetical protein
MVPDIEGWLRQNCAEYQFDIRGVFRGSSPRSSWPLHAGSPELLEAALVAGGHLLPLPKEPAALANILEVSIVDFLLSRLATVPGAEAVRGTERGYPDLEIFGSAFGDQYHAVDVKAARRAVGGLRTQSRITLYTGNTYFKWPHLRWPGTFRPFEEYAAHLDVIAIYTLEINAAARVATSRSSFSSPGGSPAASARRLLASTSEPWTSSSSSGEARGSSVRRRTSTGSGAPTPSG